MTVIWRDSTDPTTYDVICCHGIFNQDRPSYRPIAVVKATSPREVLDAVAISKDQRCQIAVRAGGHSIPVWSLHKDSILVDLGGWKEINLQPESGVVEVTPAVTSEELNQYLTVGFERMFPGGHCPSVGIGGFVLSGGNGWNARCKSYGWACEYLSAVEVVTSQGALLLCNSQQNQELYWAARGAGPAFPGIVTRLFLKTLPFYKDGLRTSGYLYPKHLHRTVVEWLRFLVPSVSKNTEVIMIAQYSDNELCYLVKFVTMGSTLPEAEQSLRQIQETRPRGTITEWNNQEETFNGLYEIQAKANPSSHYYYTDDVFIDNNANVAAVLESAFRLPPGKSYAFWNPMYPCSRRELSGMALGIQSDHYVSIYGISENRDEAERHKGWLQNTMAKIRPHAVGAYLGESDPGMLPGSWFWGEHNARLLMEVSQRWDPDGLFAAAHCWPGKEVSGCIREP